MLRGLNDEGRPRGRAGRAGRIAWAGAATLFCLLTAQACGSRTGLFDDELDPGTMSADASVPPSGDAQPPEPEDGAPPPPPPPPPQRCYGPDETQPCGSDVGTCRLGVSRCIDGYFGPCEGDVRPQPEQCNDLDDDCDGVIDNGFGIGQACDGPDTDLCTDDVMTCAGCSRGKDDLEVCNGRDDDCDGEIDSDCEFGSCSPSLLVTGSTPSSPNCIDFPVVKGSTGKIDYPCTGGPVSANIGSILFTGTSQNNRVVLTGTARDVGPDRCIWEFSHRIEGNLPSGQLTYSYSERVVSGSRCWQPCTEIGTVEVHW